MRVTSAMLKGVDDGSVDLVSLVSSDLELYCELALKIETKTGTLLPLVFNDAQAVLHSSCEEQLGRKGKVRKVLLKARQYGGTTYIAGRVFKGCATKEHQHGKVVAQSDEAVGRILGIYQRFYTYMPDYLRPMKKYRTKTEMHFSNPSPIATLVAKEPGLDSSIGVYSAGSRSAGRGSTLRYLHCSEVAFWNGVETASLLLGLFNTVPGDGPASLGTEVYLESTANGMGDYFHRKYLKARSGDDGDFEALFIPWYLHSEYRSPCSPGFGEALTKMERDLVHKDHPHWAFVNPATGGKRLSLEQVMWRRIALATACDGDERKFKQEYPLTDEEAFVATGASFFPVDKVQDRLNKVMATPDLLVWRGEIEETEKTELEKTKKAKRHRERDTKVILLEDELNGRLFIFEKPRDKERYIWFADVAEGVEDGDFSEIHVLNQKTGFQAAVWRGRVGPDILGDICYALARHYNWARGTPESQGHGLVTLLVLQERRFPFIYRRKMYDEHGRDSEQLEGWRTTSRTRPVMLEALRGGFRENSVTINDAETLRQMLTFSMVRGRLRAQDGTHDDAVMAVAGAAQLLLELPMPLEGRVRNYLEDKDKKRDGLKRERLVHYRQRPKYNLITGALEG